MPAGQGNGRKSIEDEELEKGKRRWLGKEGSARRVQSCGVGCLPAAGQRHCLLTCCVTLGEASYLTSLGPSFPFKVELLRPTSQDCCEDNTR